MKCTKCGADDPESQRFCGECGTKLTPRHESPTAQTAEVQTQDNELTTGTIFAGRYQVIEELGKGGMGRCREAEDRAVGIRCLENLSGEVRLTTRPVLPARVPSRRIFIGEGEEEIGSPRWPQQAIRRKRCRS